MEMSGTAQKNLYIFCEYTAIHYTHIHDHDEYEHQQKRRNKTHTTTTTARQQRQQAIATRAHRNNVHMKQ